MRKFLLLAAIAAMAFPASADAGVLSSLLSFDGAEDIINDDSVGNFREVMGNTTDGRLVVGDLLQGVINFNPIDGNGVPTGQSVIGIYSLEIVSIGAGGTSLELRGATGAQSVNAIMAAAGVDTSGLTGTFAGAANGFAVLESSVSDITGRADFLGPVDATGTGFGFTTTNLSSNYSAVATLGFDGVDDNHTIFSAAPGGVPLDLTDTTVAAGFAGTGISFAGFHGAYSITDHAFGTSVAFLPILNPITGGFGDVTIVNGSVSGTDSATVGNGWDFNDDGDFRLNAVPEPATAAMFGCIGMVALLGRRRK